MLGQAIQIDQYIDLFRSYSFCDVIETHCLGINERVKRALQAQAYFRFVIRTDRYSKNLELRSVMAFENAGDKIGHRVRTKIRRYVADANSAVSIDLSTPERRAHRRAHFSNPQARAIELVFNGRTNSEKFKWTGTSLAIPDRLNNTI